MKLIRPTNEELKEQSSTNRILCITLFFMSVVTLFIGAFYFNNFAILFAVQLFIIALIVKISEIQDKIRLEIREK